VVTNVEYDHPDCFSTPENYFQAFEKFVQGIEENGILVASINDPGSTRLLHQQGKLRIKPVSFGIRSDSSQTQPDYVARDLTLNDWGGYRFSIIKNNAELTVVSLRVPGEHNVRNALATLAVTDQLGLSISEAVRALGAFQGTGRRFEVLGEVAGIVVIDDYAHHPSEIRATLAGARSRFTGRSLWAVWQPHTFSRTQLFFNDFANAFKDADHVLVTEVYGAREKSSTGFSAERIVKVMDHPDAHFIHGVREATEYLLNQLKSGDVLLVLSAGDGNQISANIVESLSIDRSAAHA
jgi:UDP-N-acetylmuramate--alanine ligase